MLFRQAGIHHTNYAGDRALFPIPADRWMIVGLLVLAVTAPLTANSLTLSSYLLPWLVWTSATLGLNLILGWAGQFHFGYAAIMGIGAYAAVHGARNGIPWEIAVALGGVALSWAMSAVVATIAGVLWGSVQGVDQSLSMLLLKGVTVAVLGGMDSIGGAMLAGLLLGVFESVASGYLDKLVGGGSRDLVVAATLILTIMIRPHGLFGRHDIERI